MSDTDIGCRYLEMYKSKIGRYSSLRLEFASWNLIGNSSLDYLLSHLSDMLLSPPLLETAYQLWGEETNGGGQGPGKQTAELIFYSKTKSL